MNYGLYQSWKVILPLGNDSPNYLTSNKLFNVKTGKSFMRKMGGGMENYPLKPEVLTPTSAFNDAILKLCIPLGIHGRKLPYKFKSNNINVTIHYYFEQYIAVTATLMKPIEIGRHHIESCNKLEDYPAVHKLMCAICGLILSGDHKKFIPLTSVPSISCSSLAELSEELEPISNALAVAALTGHAGAVTNIVNSVICKNENHQVNDATTLVDKQGVFQRVPYHLLKSKEADAKFSSCCALFELFSIINITLSGKKLLDNKLFINSVKKLLDHPALVTKSFTAQMTISTLANEFNINELLQPIIESENQNIEKPKSLINRFFTEFWGSKEFFSTFLPLLVSGLVGLWMIFKD
ncbi:hypothetical protein [uncultured Psychromonas sp.]|uniref:hypothetical protein n=1 Tax=uncultured Psychromonas sp. TaxID=173974 RepID=UPI00262828CA|nr:hypothetical protein [uncultured Psychromonas sp.]